MGVRENIITAAYELLCRQGYEKTSVAQIVEVSGSSKGGFYHHFKTKDEVIEAIVEGFVEDLDIRYRLLIEDETSTVFELINRVITEVNDYKADVFENQPGISKMLSYSGNAKAITHMAQEFEKKTMQCYYELFLRGIKKGKFYTKYPLQLAGTFAREIIRVYSQTTQLAVNYNQKDMDDFINSLDFLEDLINESLGLKEHLISLKDPALMFLDKARKQTGFRKE